MTHFIVHGKAVKTVIELTVCIVIDSQTAAGKDAELCVRHSK